MYNVVVRCLCRLGVMDLNTVHLMRFFVDELCAVAFYELTVANRNVIILFTACVRAA